MSNKTNKTLKIDNVTEFFQQLLILGFFVNTDHMKQGIQKLYSSKPTRIDYFNSAVKVTLIRSPYTGVVSMLPPASSISSHRHIKHLLNTLN